MFKLITVLAALVVCPAVLADEPANNSSDTSEKSICEAIAEDSFRCAQAWQICHWDPVDGRCERNPSPTGGGCSQYFNPAACNAAPFGCVWDWKDPTGPRCEALGD
jgi:hypothetical protein